MERDSFLYKARRTAQVIAHKFIPDEAMSKFYYLPFNDTADKNAVR